MSVHNKVPVKTPSQALRIADFDFMNNWSRPKQPNHQTLETRRSMAVPTSRAKRMVDLLAEIMPPPGINNTASKKSARSHTQIHKTYMSTSKKQLHNRKTDHAVVRRALNFIGNQVEDVQIHPKSKPITLKSVTGSKYKQQEVKFTNMSTAGTDNVKTEPIVGSSKVVQNHYAVSCMNNSHRYDLRSHKGLRTDVNNEVPVNYTQYRNVNQSFDASICEETSPQLKALEKSVSEYSEKPPHHTDVSDLLSDMLLKTEITAPNSSRQIQIIQSKLQENAQIFNSQMDYYNRVTAELENNRKLLITCMENNKILLEITKDILNAPRSDKKLHSNKRNSNIPVAGKCSIQSVGSKVEHKSNISSQGNWNYKEIVGIPNNGVVPGLDSLCENKENKNLTSKPLPSNDLRKTVLLTRLENNKNINLPLKHDTILSEITELKSVKTKEPPTPHLQIIKQATPKTKSPKVKTSPMRNSVQIDSAKTSKSLQIYKSLKDSVKFLKTPVGKKSGGSNVSYETPNTRSRNITSNNIKRQLESLYDS